MTREHWHQVDHLFREGAERSPGDRTRFVLQNASNDSVASEVVSLLRHASAGDFLTQGDLAPVGNLEQLVHARHAELQPGECVQRYVVRLLLGRGGMSTVYAAEQESPRRLVAIKIPAADSVAAAWTASRFQHEASCLGQLRHEGIAQIFEAGVQVLPDGSRRPYIVMEYVPDARRLTDYCSARAIPVESRVRLLVRVCRALHHGHQRGIIHLDLKPSNILVDGAGEPKVIDFGVARSSQAVRLELGADVIEAVCCGTPQYMSPEQFESRRLDIDVRSDVYSLGVVLFELLAGCRPYDLSGVLMHQALGVILASPRPSLHLERLGVDRDLRAIVDTALAQERERRYESAAAFADDLEAYLSSRPLRSRRVGLPWRAWLLGKRHRVACSAAVAGLVLGTVGVAKIVRSDLEARRADRSASTVLSLMKDMLASPKVRGNANIRFVEVLDDSAARLDAIENVALDAAEQMHATLAESYDLVGLYSRAEERYRRAAELAERAYGLADDRTIERLMGLAGSRFDLGRFDGAIAILDRVSPVVQEHHGADSPLAARVFNEYGLILFFQGRHSESEAMHRRALQIYLDREGPESEEYAKALHNLAVTMLHRGLTNQAENALVECLRISMTHTPTLNAATPRARRWLAVVLASEGRLEESQRECDQAMEELATLVGENHPFVAGVLDSLAFLDAARGDRAAAEAHLLHSIDIFSRAQGVDHPYARAEIARLDDLRAGRPLLGSRVLNAGEVTRRGDAGLE